MIRIGINSLLMLGLVLVGAQPGLLRAQAKAEDGAGPDFKEVYDLVRAHLAEMNGAQLNQAAVRALIAGLSPRVSLVTNGAGVGARFEMPGVSKSNVFEGTIAYVRVDRIGDGLASAVRESCTKLGATNKLNGVILDLRFAGGDDYASAAATAELFVKKEQPLLNWGSGMVRSKDNEHAISLPVAVLVNRQTVGAAEALAAVLRETGAGLILGSRTAGQAMIAQEFPLKNGDRLRIATAPIELGKGGILTGQGLKPDIAVEVTADDERAYYADAFRAAIRADLSAGGGLTLTNASGGTNRAVRRLRFNEAELVRERREGISEADMTAPREREPDKPLVNDPALARALDLLKGLALVRQTHS
jgi:C-terminal processing protease CtpA/Prc